MQLALASNCNPGTSYTSSMAFCVTTAVLQMRLSVHEAVRAATYGGALALGRESGNDVDGERAVGSIAVGHRADLHLLNAPSATHLAYRPGIPLTHAVWRAGVAQRRPSVSRGPLTGPRTSWAVRRGRSRPRASSPTA